MQTKDFLQKHVSLVVCLLLCAVTLIPYWQVHSFPCIDYDDPDYITKNSHVLSGLSVKNIAWAFTSTHAANWHPLTWISHMLDCRLFGRNFGFHHLTNLFLHILNASLLFLLLRSMTGALWKSAFVAALFALHPMHVESVAWLSERKDLLCALFSFLAIGAYVRYTRRRGAAGYLLTVLFFVFALLAKPMAVMLPVLLLLLDFWPLRRLLLTKHGGQPRPLAGVRSIAALIAEKLPLFFLSGASTIVTFLAQQNAGAVIPLGPNPLIVRVANAMHSYGAYLLKMFAPVNMSVLYLNYGKIPVLQTCAALFLILIVTLFAIKWTNRRPYFLTGWLWYLASLLPVIGIVQVGMQSMADRYTYLPYVGTFVILVWGIGEIFGRLPARKMIYPLIAVPALAALMLITRAQVSIWKSSESLFSHAIELDPKNYLMVCNLGAVVNNQGRVDEALELFRQAVRINPSTVLGHNNLGIQLALKGRNREAQAEFETVLCLRPGHADAHYSLGELFRNEGKNEEAAGHFRECIRLKPGSVSAYVNLGRVLQEQGRPEDAVTMFRKAADLDSNDANSHLYLGDFYSRQNNIIGAIAEFRIVIRLDSSNASAHSRLGTLLAQQGKVGEAIPYFEKALRIDPGLQATKRNLEKARSLQAVAR